VWLALTWRWFLGGPKLLKELASTGAELQRLLAVSERAKTQAQTHERETLRETFKNWSLVTATADGTVIRIRPGSMTLYVQGPIHEAVYDRLKLAWKESPLLIRLEFPLVPQEPGGVEGDRARYTLNGDWKLKSYEPSAT